MNVSRRNLLKFGVGAAALWTSGVRTASLRADEPAKKIPIGVQLYSIKEDVAKDLPGTIAAVAKMGYQGVEFADYYGRSAADLRKILDQNNLKCCGSHIYVETLLGDKLKETVEFNQTLGNKFLIVRSLSDELLSTPAAIIKTAKTLSDIAAKLKDQGMRVGYHSHDADFKRIAGATRWELLFRQTSPDVVMQLDITHCIDGGGNPVAILKEFPHRAVTIHLTEHGGKKGAVIGEGDVPWKQIFQICESTGGTEWYIVEQEKQRPGVSPMESVKLCLENLRKMGK